MDETLVRNEKLPRTSSLDKHILMYQLYQKIIQDCLIEIKKETKLNDISFILDEIEKK